MIATPGEDPCGRRASGASLRASSGGSELGAEVLDRVAQALVEPHLGLPAEHLARARDVRLADLRVVDRKFAMHDAALASGERTDALGEIHHRHLGRVADVHGLVYVRIE